MEKSFSQSPGNPVVLITGAGQGIGKSVAQTLAQQGMRIAVNDANKKLAQATVSEFKQSGFNAIAVAGDVTLKADVQKLVQQTIDHFGALHVLVNNAGILYPTQVIDIPEDEWDRVINVNLKGTFLCSQATLPVMQKNNWGRIVNFSSTAGKNISTVGGAHYTAAKAGILGFTRHLAKEVARFNITVNAVCPGLIDTDMVRETIAPDRQRAYANSFPIPRLGRPEEVADLVAFLCSDKAAYITGASLDINGGDLMI
jgi:NAD(P)-dependent dehydrogenase (short-subunit alcohol dehydrogenase family)